MMKQKLLLILAFLAGGTVAVRAQQDAQFSQYMFNKLYLNPATAGVDGEFGEFSLIHRSQWLGYTSTFNDGKAPTTQSFGFSMPMPRKATHEGNLWGIGLNAVNDQIGAFTSQEAHLSLSHHIRLKSGQLSLGLKGGVFRQTIDFDLYRPVDPGDPLIQPLGRLSDVKADLAAGLYYSTTKYFVGLGVGRLLGSSFNFGQTADPIQADGFTRLVPHANLLLGYHWEAGRNLVVSPSALLKFAADNNLSAEISLIGTFSEKYYAGVAYRQGDAATLLLGIHLLPQQQLRLGYAFDLVVQGVDAKSATSQEIRLAYRVPPILVRGPSIIRTPRFRHF
jgi:type IX secretion system PorP/SprF family membrane protein